MKKQKTVKEIRHTNAQPWVKLLTTDFPERESNRKKKFLELKEDISLRIKRFILNIRQEKRKIKSNRHIFIKLVRNIKRRS